MEQGLSQFNMVSACSYLHLIVGHNQKGFLPLLEIVVQPNNSVQVQVVCGLLRGGGGVVGVRRFQASTSTELRQTKLTPGKGKVDFEKRKVDSALHRASEVSAR